MTKSIEKDLLEPSAYPEQTKGVELVQTHISLIFITDEYVYKVKKPVNFGFLDFSTPEKRLLFCRKEVELNRRLSPDIYLGVSRVTDEGDRLVIEGTGKTVEHAVKMKKIPMDRIMLNLLEDGKLTTELLDRVAKKLADFHKAAETSPEIDGVGSLEVVRFNTDENFDQTERYIGKSITKPQFESIKHYTNEFYEKKKDLFEKRIQERRIRDCHGDLHMQHVCFADGIIIFDCIEFNDRFRYSDTAADIAFLAMDLDYCSRADLSNALIEAYVKYSGDSGIHDVLNFYKTYRAYVRGKVTSFLLDDPRIPEDGKRKAIETARRYFSLAESYIKVESGRAGTGPLSKSSPILVIACGLTGTGKSSIMNEVARKKGFAILASDIVRKELAGISLGEHRYEKFDEGIYAGDVTERTYIRMAEEAGRLLAKGNSVILDACFPKRWQRQRVFELAKDINARFLCIEFVCPESVARERLERRFGAKEGISDGRWEIYAAQKKTFEPVDEFPSSIHLVVDTSGSKREIVEEVMKKLDF